MNVGRQCWFIKKAMWVGGSTERHCFKHEHGSGSGSLRGLRSHLQMCGVGGSTTWRSDYNEAMQIIVNNVGRTRSQQVWALNSSCPINLLLLNPALSFPPCFLVLGVLFCKS